MKYDWIITVGREFCTGGADAAKELAKRLNYRYLDKVLVDETAEVMEVSREMVEKSDEKPEGYWDIPPHWYMDEDDPTVLLTDAARVVNAQTDVIMKYAKDRNCVIVGRCADYILRDEPHLLRVFFYADFNERVKIAMERYGLTDSKARRLIRRTDKQRATYYNRNTRKRQWGHPASYDLYLNLVDLGIDGAIKAIMERIDLEERIHGHQNGEKEQQ